MKFSKRFETAFTTVALATFGLALSLFFHWEIIQNDTPIVEKSASVIHPPRTKNGIPAFYPGETMTIEREICSDGRQPRALYRQFEDHLVFSMQLSNTPAVAGCNKRQFPIEIPKALPSGPYKYKVVVEYRINPLKPSVKIPLHVIDLMVLPKK